MCFPAVVRLREHVSARSLLFLAEVMLIHIQVTLVLTTWNTQLLLLGQSKIGKYLPLMARARPGVKEK